MSKMTTKQLRSQLEQLESEKRAINEELRTRARQKRIKCTYCSKQTVISKCDYLILNAYDPYGGNGWDRGAWYEAAHAFHCPKCDTWNMLQDNSVNEQRLGDSYPRRYPVEHPCKRLKRNFASVEKMETSKFKDYLTTGHLIKLDGKTVMRVHPPILIGTRRLTPDEQSVEDAKNEIERRKRERIAAIEAEAAEEKASIDKLQ